MPAVEESRVIVPGKSRFPPRRDYVLLPLLSLLTLAVLFCAVELFSRMAFPGREDDSCFYESATGPRERANCVSFERAPESPRVKNVFDACGNRSLNGCGAKPKGALRIVVLGSSVAEANLVPLERSYMALAQDEMRRVLGHPVEFIPVAAPLASPVHEYLRLDEALALQPDAVVLLLSPIDIEGLWMFFRDGKPAIGQRGETAAHATRDWNHYLSAAQGWLKDSRAVLAAEHLMFRDPSAFLRLYLLYGYKAGFLRQPLPAPWRQRFNELGVVELKMSQRLSKAGVPFYVAAVPSRAGAVLLNARSWPPGIDPYAWGREVQSVSENSGARYIDVLSAFARTPGSGAFFYPVDGHMNEAAQPLLSGAIVKALTTAR